MRTTDHYQRVTQMMKAFGQECPDKPTMPDAKTRMLRVRLDIEEALELAHHAGVTVDVKLKDGTVVDLAHDPDRTMNEILEFDLSHREPNLAGMYDSTCDLSVVNTGAMIAMGLPDKPGLELVDSNNLLKVARGHTHPETGKFIKPKDHPVPNYEVLIEQLS